MKTVIRVLVAGAACLLVAGCATTTAEMLARPGGAYGPTSGPDFGLVRYLADGSSSDVAAREQDANRQMSEACSGHYRILRKGSRNQLSLSPAGRFGRMAFATNENYVYIKYVCTRM